MADLSIGIRIGAALAGSFSSAFTGARGTLGQLGQVADQLRARHTRLGEAMARAASHPARNVDALRRQYERLGQTLEQLRIRQERLAASMARGAALRQQRSAMGAELIGTYAGGVAAAVPMIGAVKQAANFESGLRDIAINGNLKAQEEFQLGHAIRKAALTTNQGHAAILQGVGTLVSSGMDAKKAGEYSGLLGKVSTATNADMKEIAAMVYSLSETLGIKGEAPLKEAFNRAAFGGKLGRFELKDMAKSLPEMTAAFAGKGIMGQQALTEIIASLEVGREAAGSGDEAVTNLRNWMAHMNAQHTISNYNKAGVDYQKSMSNLVSSGDSSYEASLKIANKFIAGKGDAFMKAWKDAGAKGNEDAQRRLMESFGLNEVFQDIQTINHLLAMRQGWDKYQQNKKQMGSKQAMGTIDEDYQKRINAATKAWEKFKTGLADLGISVGSALLPALTSLMTTLTPMIGAFGKFAEAHPGVIRAVAGTVLGIVGLKIAFLSLGWGINFFIRSPLNTLSTVWNTVASKWTLLRALLLSGGSRLSSFFQLFGMGAARANAFVASIGRMGSWIASAFTRIGPFFLRFVGLARSLAGVLAGRLVSGIMMAGRAVLWLGRALMMNPIGLAITAIAVSAYLIYRYWDKIKPWFANLWASVKAIFTGAADWMKGITDSFAGFGAHIIDGLVNGIKSKFSAAKDTIVEFGQNLKGWFADTLGIQSPSRIFLGFGDNIAQGAALGIGRSAALATRAVATMAQASATAWGKPELASPFVDVANRVASVVPRASGNEQGPNASGGMTVHFSPQITVQGGDPALVQNQVNQALQSSYPEFERMMKRYEANRKRGSYGGNA
ncbi:phage tail tape measure protein [Iodobacter fluviatilis]|uniref:Phage-related minor tail protein n=1 Tax=Iodobacter fluviatilis TaxID=537 RepID=A0A377Q9K8_9NEIS|nr:phage tail tape measure protein [Iodobacter fluviatilis]TCU88519.1 TP901 family phage tail tape measure protein [Iodobacter fluviatilis]STQ91410.1 Phage-related minor tail protein [Iodobacter fluviatilis]